MDSTHAQILKLLETPFYSTPEFWISTIIGLAGLWFSIRAFREAQAARQAAVEAGTTVKMQTVTIELTEISQRLDSLDPDIDYPQARDLLNEISRRLRRLVSPFEKVEDLGDKIQELKRALEDAKQALSRVRPSDFDDFDDSLSPQSVYFGTESFFSAISGLVADLMGLFEKRAIAPDEE